METVFGFFVALIIFYVLLEWRLGRTRRESERRYADLEAKTRWLYKMLSDLQVAPPKPAEAPVEAAPAASEPIDEPAAEEIAVPRRPTFAEEGVAELHAEEMPAAKEPGWLSKLLFGGNILAKIGVVLLIFGVGSALKLAAEFGVLPAEARLGLAALFGVALGVLGWRKRAGHEMFGFALQGGGVAVLYLVVYFALTRYELITTVPAFALFVVLGVGGMLLAALQDGRSLAVLGLVGAFLAPILASSDAGNHVVLFSYFTLLNLFIFGLSWFRSWRSLNVAGFLLTFAIGVNWGLKFYRPEYFPTTEPFPLTDTEPFPETAPSFPEPPPSASLSDWPVGTSGYTVILSSVPTAQGRSLAEQQAQSAILSGLTGVGVLDSSQFSSLRPGFYVVFTGVFSTLDDAQSTLQQARSAGYPTAYTRRIRP